MSKKGFLVLLDQHLQVFLKPPLVASCYPQRPLLTTVQMHACVHACMGMHTHMHKNSVLEIHIPITPHTFLHANTQKNQFGRVENLMSRP